ncbi:MULTISPECIES: transcriptional regulator [Rhodococcus]|uniref:Transcriptional regulator n=1 Tax=Rhodococcus oxybenzonivorans TaxID=1990687 RepID=A0AAE4UY63_9NOCA|nr:MULTISPECIES: transcriptional regulator [Rhodococcus]MDV7245596.1 transcriptional regulator [Rhodococcus oxybenzonivorans]MDV7264404.1 transcriptional regulator [Rhodococcus oxybenzonivorans]MDV7277049.1 transcriptional regulator [Rhodococcus oxybenzonivorans]MDV7336620.1 transcriptional regulator [Rhodococcus oxybenzonivorans]MDV7346497.1 transcriptional regulator [Rhodococcus oxybenzonivorans]
MQKQPPTGGNPWVAVRPGDDVAVLARRVSSAHQLFVDRSVPAVPDTEQNAVRSVILDSWMRSTRKGVNPDGAARADHLAASELAEYRASHPMALIRPVVRKLLVEDAADTGLLVAITDEKGQLLWVEGDSSAKDRALDMNFVEGADWSEDTVGTNAPGTALALDHCVQIFGAEHFSRSVHEWSCSAAPVHDPATGLIVGAIDITGGPRVAVPEVLSLIRATVAAAEAELRLNLLRSPQPLVDTVTRLQVLGSGRPSLVRGGRRTPLSQRHAEILLLLAEHPEGLSSDRLAVLLDESDLDSVTIRAEMSRLRKVFGTAGIGSRPYRLLADLVSDVQQVRSALDRGELAAALDIYSGPVLPGSDAPGVEDIRDELRARVQAALLREGDQRLLARWTTSVHGRADVAAWEAYLAGLDPRSPLYSQVKSRVDLFDQQYAT